MKILFDFVEFGFCEGRFWFDKYECDFYYNYGCSYFKRFLVI